MQESLSKSIKSKFHKDLKLERVNLHNICSIGRTSRGLNHKYRIKESDGVGYLSKLEKLIDVITSLLIFIIFLPLLLLVKLDSYLESISDIFLKSKIRRN